MGLTISIIGFVILVILTVYFGWKSLPKYYIGFQGAMVDVKRRREYHQSYNKYTEVEKISAAWYPITKEQYEAKMDEYAKALPCGCKLGEGRPDWEIVKRYDAEKIAKDVFGVNIEYTYVLATGLFSNKKVKKMCYEYKGIRSRLKNTSIVKKACLKCGTCKDEYYDLIQEISDGIRRIDKEIEEKENRKRRAKEICKTSKKTI